MNELIFSSERSKRLSRHFLFWSGWFIYLSCTQLRNQTPDEIGMNHFIVYQLGVSANRLILQMLFCYPLIYYILPRFFTKGNYKQFTIIILIFIALVYWITYFDYTYIWSDESSPIYFYIPNVKPLNTFQAKYFAIYSNLHCTGTIVAFCIISSVKYYKNWFQKERENEMLLYQNSQAELQLLKAQVHPHFLFNTLNNIYALMLDDSPKTVTVLNELSGMVLYMTKEGSLPLVPLDKEIKMLSDYIGLEKIRYGDRLEMIPDIQYAHSENLMIAPLLMLPFVENSFKHGASKTIEKTKIHLHIFVEKERLCFKISNHMNPVPPQDRNRIKIGLNNAKKRLEILYPGKHLLNIRSDNKLFEVVMEVFLGMQKSEHKMNINHKQTIPAYV